MSAEERRAELISYTFNVARVAVWLKLENEPETKGYIEKLVRLME